MSPGCLQMFLPVRMPSTAENGLLSVMAPIAEDKWRVDCKWKDLNVSNGGCGRFST